jgi:hypothetical protein
MITAGEGDASAEPNTGGPRRPSPGVALVASSQVATAVPKDKQRQPTDRAAGVARGRTAMSGTDVSGQNQEPGCDSSGLLGWTIRASAGDAGTGCCNRWRKQA